MKAKRDGISSTNDDTENPGHSKAAKINSAKPKVAQNCDVEVQSVTLTTYGRVDVPEHHRIAVVDSWTHELHVPLGLLPTMVLNRDEILALHLLENLLSYYDTHLVFFEYDAENVRIGFVDCRKVGMFEGVGTQECEIKVCTSCAERNRTSTHALRAQFDSWTLEVVYGLRTGPPRSLATVRPRLGIQARALGVFLVDDDVGDLVFVH